VTGPGEEQDQDRGDQRDMGESCGGEVEFVTRDSTAVGAEIDGEIYDGEWELVSEVTQDLGCFLRI